MMELSNIHIDVEELLDELRLEWLARDESRYNDTALTKMKPSGSNLMFCCPYHNETNPSCGILVDHPYTFNCFGCGQGGSLGTLVAHLIGLKGELQGIQYLMKNYLTVSVKERPKIDLESILDGNDLDRKVTIPEEEALKFTKKRHSYIVSRGFSDRTIRKYEVGFDEASQSITFPIRTSNGLIRFIKRRSVHKKQFLNKVNIYKKDIVYGLYYILQSPKPIYEIDLNESETDTMACYESGRPAGAILGRILFKEQVKELLMAGIKTVNLFFDNDEAGVQCTLQAIKTLADTPIRVNVVIYPDGHYGIDTIDDEELLYKDSNDLLKAKKIKSIEIVTFNEFLMKLKNAKKIKID